MFVDEKSVGEQQEVHQRITRLSQAIRMGAILRQQCTEWMFAEGRSCALGAAYEAVEGHPGRGMYGFGHTDQRTGEAMLKRLRHRFPWLSDQENLAQVYNRNDGGETREQIADWLEAQGY